MFCTVGKEEAKEVLSKGKEAAVSVKRVDKTVQRRSRLPLVFFPCGRKGRSVIGESKRVL